MKQQILMNDIYAIMKNRKLIYFEETMEAQQTLD